MGNAGHLNLTNIQITLLGLLTKEGFDRGKQLLALLHQVVLCEEADGIVIISECEGLTQGRCQAVATAVATARAARAVAALGPGRWHECERWRNLNTVKSIFFLGLHLQIFFLGLHLQILHAGDEEFISSERRHCENASPNFRSV